MHTINRVSIARGAVCRVVTSTLLLLSALFAGSSPLHAAKKSEPADKDRVPEGVSASDWQSIRAAHEAWQHAIEAVKGGWQARNPAQQWTTKFDGRGFEAKPQSADWTWGLELRSYGAGDEQRAVNGTPEVKAEGHRLAYHWDDTVQEWFVNDGRGLEHGFSVQERPPGPSDAPLTFLLATRGPLRAAVTDNARAVDYRDQSGATVLTYSGLRVWDAEGRELEARFAPAKDGVTLQVDAKNARYPLLIDPIAQQAYFKAFQAAEEDGFGHSVAIDGDTAVVGAPFESSSTTGVNSVPNESALFAGAAYIFAREGNMWTQQAYLKASNTGAGDKFGTSVSVSGDKVVVGAPGEDTLGDGTNVPSNNNKLDAGAAYIFELSGADWEQTAFLKQANFSDQPGDQFGHSVAVSGGIVLVGAWGNAQRGPDSGKAFFFARLGDESWSLTNVVYAEDATGRCAGDKFGWSVAISGNYAVIGAPGEDSSTKGVDPLADEKAPNAGAAYVFRRSPGPNPWSRLHYLKSSNTEAGDGFGWSVAIDAGASDGSGDYTVVVGAPQEEESGVVDSNYDSGAAYVFTDAGWDGRDIRFQQPVRLVPSNPGEDDEFGRSVAVAGDIVPYTGDAIAVVGAPWEDSSTTGIDSVPSDIPFYDSGAAYVFTRTGWIWTQQAYLKASNTGEDDEFGTSVAISGETVVVGAPGEDGDGKSANDNLSDAGAAYAFTGVGTPIIDSAATASGQVSVPFTYQVTTSSAATAADSFGATGLPPGLAIDPATGLITGIPTQEGTFKVELFALKAGSKGEKTLTVTIAPPPPPAPPVITSPLTATAQHKVPFSYQITTSGGTPTSYGMGGDFVPGLTFDPAKGLITGAPLSAGGGTYSVLLLASNSSGEDKKDLILAILPAPPKIVNDGFEDWLYDVVTEAYQRAIYYGGEDAGDPTSFAVTGLPPGLSYSTSTQRITGIPTEEGTFMVTLTASNAGGTDTKIVPYVIKPGSPLIDSPTTASGQVGVPFTYQATSTVGGKTTTFAANNLPPGLNISADGAITGTPTQEGVTSVLLTASNSTGNSSVATLTINIGPPVPPVINSATMASGQVGTAFSYQITTSGGTATSFNATGSLPAGLTLNSTTGAITGTPSQAGSSTVTLTASNSAGSDTETLAITIAPAPMPSIPPVITTVSLPDAVVGAPYNFKISTSGGTPTDFDFAAAVSPAVNDPGNYNLQIDNTGKITGTPQKAAKAPLSVKVTASNGAGSDTKNYTLAIQLPPKPVIEPPLTAKGKVGVSFSYQVKTSGGTPTLYTAAGLPKGLTMNQSTGEIGGTPKEATPIKGQQVTLEVSNAGGLQKDSKKLTLTIEPASQQSQKMSAQVKILPAQRTIKAGKEAKIMVLVENNTTREQTVDIVFNSTNSAGLPAPETKTVKLRPKKSEKAAATAVRFSVLLTPAATSVRGASELTASINGEPSAPCLIKITPK